MQRRFGTPSFCPDFNSSITICRSAKCLPGLEFLAVAIGMKRQPGTANLSADDGTAGYSCWSRSLQTGTIHAFDLAFKDFEAPILELEACISSHLLDPL